MKTIRVLARIQLAAIADMAITLNLALRPKPKPRAKREPKAKPVWLDQENYGTRI